MTAESSGTDVEAPADAVRANRSLTIVKPNPKRIRVTGVSIGAAERSAAPPAVEVIVTERKASPDEPAAGS